ncbi:MAG: TonB-dependent receptor plug domain-containing protein [Phycisphaerales bacterium]|nr:TonB-dependent receptor plug domain-containing protein [Phycisphaerales bacterium]
MPQRLPTTRMSTGERDSRLAGSRPHTATTGETTNSRSARSRPRRRAHQRRSLPSRLHRKLSTPRHPLALLVAVGLALGLGALDSRLLAQTATTPPPAPASEQHAAPPEVDSDPSLATGSPAGASSETPPDSLGDELLLFESMPLVISGSRTETPINQSSVPVSILSADDIHYRALTNLAEQLTFVPGVQISRISKNRYAVGIRGLHHEFSDRTLVLLNGRNATNPLLGGTDFLAIPILMEDIKRIEVVRGPGGAAWGANAFGGVINVITKDPAETQGVFASSTLSEFGDSFNHLRWGAAAGKLSWRLSFGYDDYETSEDSLTNDHFESEDWGRLTRIDADGVYQLGDATKLRFGIAHGHIERGPFEFGSYLPDADERIDTSRLFAKLEHEWDSGASAYVQWFGNFESSNRPTLTRVWSSENDLEAQYSTPMAGGHTLSVGGNARFVHIEQTPLDPQDFIYGGAPFDEFWAGLFAIDRWQATERLALEGQVRADFYSAQSIDFSARLAALYALDDGHHHILRVGAARAYRAPLAGIRNLQFQRSPLPSPPLPPGLYGFNFFPSGGLDNETVWSAELGYSGRLAEGLTLRADTFYQRFDDLIGVETFSSEPFFGTLSNNGGADNVGTELELALSGETGRLSAWYAYNGLSLDEVDQDTRSFYTAPHTAGLSGRLFLPDDWTLNADYKYSDFVQANANNSSPDNYHRLDLTLSRSFAQGQAELIVGVTDLLDMTDFDVAPLGSLTSHEVPGRTFFARVQFKF